MSTENKQEKYENALKYEIFTKEEYGFAKSKIKKAECVFDIGWHIWLFSQWCRNLNSNTQIHYFEPVKEFYNKAKNNIWNDKNIILNNFWISSHTGDWTLLLNHEKTMQSSKYTSFLNPKWIEIGVNFKTLKDYLDLANINKIDVLKLDIEWMEFEVFESRWKFEWSKINNLIAEIHLLNSDMESQWNLILRKIRLIFWDTQIINPSYDKRIFLIRCQKIS